MIQRIQTIYLGLATLALATLMIFDPVWQSQAAMRYDWFLPAWTATGVGAAGLAFVAIFFYRRRKRQRKFVLGAQSLTVLAALVLYGSFYFTGELGVRVGGSIDVMQVIVLLLPLIAYVFLVLGRRGIERDIQKVEDMDRFRLRDDR